MKLTRRTKRDESRIIFWNIFSLLFVIWFSLVIVIHIIPQIDEIELLKSETLQLSKNLKAYEKEWIPLENLKTTIAENKKDLNIKLDDSYVNSLLSEISQDFYDKNLKNKTDSSYNKFIEDKLEKFKDSSTNEEKIKLISKILPYYSDTLKEEDGLTDFQFINYIESIIYTFGLSYNNAIWIKEIKQLDNYWLTKTDSLLDKWIYEIPVELNITWSKSSIIDFLYYIENVWKLSVNEKNNELIINKEDPLNRWLFSEFRTKRLDWQRWKSWEYNIFNNQIIDIANIQMSKYIDSSDTWIDYSWVEDKQKFLKYIKSTQNKEIFEVKIKLNFYVKWLPKYKIENFISAFNTKLSKLTNETNLLLWKTSITSTEKQKLTSIKLNLENIKNSVKWTSNASNEIMNKYQDISSYSSILNTYETEIETIKNKYTKK